MIHTRTKCGQLAVEMSAVVRICDCIDAACESVVEARARDELYAFSILQAEKLETAARLIREYYKRSD